MDMKKCFGMVAVAALGAFGGELVVEPGGAYADPLFANAAANDFRLTPGSPAFALGFEAWDYSAAGPQRQ